MERESGEMNEEVTIETEGKQSVSETVVVRREREGGGGMEMTKLLTSLRDRNRCFMDVDYNLLLR